MSGGHWNYMGERLRERGVASEHVWKLLAALEHELDWGVCGDTCLACAKLRCAEALVAFFDDHCEDSMTAVAVARDHQQNNCKECEIAALNRISAGKP